MLSGLFVVNSASAESCVTINETGNNYYTVNARLNHSTHIILPEVLIGEPIVGNNQLWDAEILAGNNLIIKPSSELPAGESTTINVISENNNAYFFVAKRVTGSANYCVIVKNRGAFGANNSTFSRANPAVKADNKVRELEEELAKQKRVQDEKIVSAIKRYENDIYSNYKIKRLGNPSSKLISVFDDGRVTKFNFDDHRKGVPVIVGYLGRKEHLLQASPEDNINLYSVIGIYDKFDIKFDKRNGYRVERLEENER